MLRAIEEEAPNQNLHNSHKILYDTVDTRQPVPSIGTF